MDLPKAAMRVAPIDDLFVPIMNLDRNQRLAYYEEPSFVEKFVAATDRDDWNTRYWPNVIVNYAPTRPDAEGRRLVALAKEQGVHAARLMIELGIETKLEVLFGVETSWSNAREEHETLLKRPSVVFGLSDGGAHMAQIADSRFPTSVLDHWVRDRGFSVEWAVWMLTKKSADAFGIVDRGTLTPGLAADICIFDADTVTDGKLERRNDLPAGARRIIAVPKGLDYVIVNGEVLREHNQDMIAGEAKLPGKVLREFAPHAAHPAG
jgi:N-acyl-D-aspartate/D-glutamate deacylase